YEYQLTIRLMNNEPHFTNGFLLLVENPSFTSPMATLHYEFYQGAGELQAHLEAQAEQLQCLVSSKGLFPGSMPFGQTQYPALWDCADKVDTLRFLLDRWHCNASYFASIRMPAALTADTANQPAGFSWGSGKRLSILVGRFAGGVAKSPALVLKSMSWLKNPYVCLSMEASSTEAL